MKKLWIILLCLLLFGCNPDVSGHWADESGDVSIEFKDDTVIFFGIEGTYKLKNKTIIMTLGSSEYDYKYDMVDDTLILYLESGELRLEKK